MAKLNFNDYALCSKKRIIDPNQPAIDKLVERWEIIDQAVMQLNNEQFAQLCIVAEMLLKNSSKYQI